MDLDMDIDVNRLGLDRHLHACGNSNEEGVKMIFQSLGSVLRFLKILSALV